MTSIRAGSGWLGTIFFLIVLCLGISAFNTSLIFNGDARTLRESITYTERKIDHRTIELREEYMGITRQQAKTNRYLIYLTCTAKKTTSECRKEQEELDQLQHESQLPNE
jgi:hypothetical protein